jgi:CheY-like chemotaxis protein
VQEALRLVRSSLPASIDIEVRNLLGDEQVMANSAELHRVILNLCTNAYHAMRDQGKGHLFITIARHSGSPLGWSMHSDKIMGEHLRLSVGDTGTGIPAEVLPRIFEPFYTTKKQGEGTGLGLSVVHGIVTRCRGFISVETEVGSGTTFHLYLPLLPSGMTVHADQAAGSPRPAQASGGARSAGDKTIKAFMVDDEYAITRVAKSMLAKYGIALETENDSTKALRLFQENGCDFDLVITDHMMPGMVGTELARHIREIRPELPIIMCTGYSDSVSPEHAKSLGICEFILKPPDFHQMAATIKALAGKHPQAT